MSVTVAALCLSPSGALAQSSAVAPAEIYGRAFGDPLIDCVGVQVFVDGATMPQPFDVNTIPPQRIKAIELYRGPATTPLELRTPKTVCGTLAIWTR